MIARLSRTEITLRTIATTDTRIAPETLTAASEIDALAASTVALALSNIPMHRA